MLRKTSLTQPDPWGPIDYESVAERLPLHIPELREAYEAEWRWWGGEWPGPHVALASVLNPYLDRLLESGDDAALSRAFEFIELLSRQSDKQVREVVQLTVCEYLGQTRERLQGAQRFMGPLTRRYCDDMDKSWETGAR